MCRSTSLWLLSVMVGAVLFRVSAAGQDETGSESIEERWSSMTDAERAAMRANYERWKTLEEGDQVLLRQRHRHLQQWRNDTLRRLGDGERRQLDQLPRSERQRELLQRTRDGVRGVLESLPRSLRAELDRRLPQVPVRERSEWLARRIQEELGQRFPRWLDALAERGVLNASQRADIQRRFRAGDAKERYSIVLRLMRRVAEESTSRDVVDVLTDEPDAVAAFRSMRRARALQLTEHDLERYLRGHGVPERALRRLRAADTPHVLVPRICHEFKVVPPHALQRYLRSEGVTEEAMRRLFTGDMASFDGRLQRILELWSLRGMDWEEYRQRLQRGRRAGDRSNDGAESRREGRAPARRSDGRRLP